MPPPGTIQDRSRLAPPPEVWRPVFEPIIADEHATGVADELNRAAEGLDIQPQPVIVRRRPNEPEAKARVMRSRIELSAVSALDTIEVQLMAALLCAADGSDGEGRSAEAALTVRRSKPGIPPAVCTFTPGSASAHAAHPSIAAPVATEPSPAGFPRKPYRIEPVLDAGHDIAWELNRFAEGTEVSSPTSVVLTPSRAAFDPIAPEVHSATSLADELNRASEGLIIAAAAPDRIPPPSPESAARRDPPPRIPALPERASPPEPPSDVARALRLTSEAVHAWMNVVTGPSLPHLSAR